ncbi:nuclear transport factor 2 family protein [Sphingomonas jatrophae]|uniref:SnoaL-like domain-containing protein n=1 Tax=Sphingomonas jatrophae TaxID=1166337 RepID=A0A1I6M3U6_9SPHN|nr:nuclear transport factor 2 family protein [Sphingomonas jatrophae]SFS10385.1 SnoaL-like domain-containing protein [Sphingomonas jatrophae]
MSTLQTVADRIDIADLMARYARAVDRCDAALFDTVWAPGAIVDYGEGPEDAAQWSLGLLGRLRAMERTQHALSNSLVDLAGDHASAETMCTAYHQLTVDGQAQQMIVGGRYLDRLVRTREGWRIAERRYVMDWNEIAPSTCEIGSGRFARFSRTGARAPDDPSYA